MANPISQFLEALFGMNERGLDRGMAGTPTGGAIGRLLAPQPDFSLPMAASEYPTPQTGPIPQERPDMWAGLRDAGPPVDPMQTASAPAQRQAPAADPYLAWQRGMGSSDSYNAPTRGPVAGTGGRSALAGGTGADRLQGGSPASGGGGIGGLLGNLFNPGGAQRNRTVEWLTSQGMDPGTATFVAGNKKLLQGYLSDRLSGGTEFEQRARAAQQYGLSGKEAQQFILSGDLQDSEKDLVNAGKGRLYDPNTGRWLTAPDMGTDAPTVQSFYDKDGREYKAQWDAQKREWVPVGASKMPSGMSLKTNPDGTVEFVQGAGAGQKLTEGQSKDLAYYTMGSDADAILSTNDVELTDWGQQNAGKIPLGIGNYFREPAFRQAKQAGDRFLTALLRKETGAAVTDSEWSIYGPMFLPIPGDDAGTIEQKRRGRQVALMAIRSGLGTAEAIAEANRITLGLPELRPSRAKTPVVIDGYTIEEVE